MRSLLFCLLLFVPALGVAQVEIEHLLAEGDAPAGVVFEIVEGEEDDLGWALPKVARLSQGLRTRFPDLEIVIVSHGREQFGLLGGETTGPLAPIHAEVQELRAAGIGLHVCGVHAGWYGYTPEDFPHYVDVAASGPAQIRDYENLGYTVVRLRRDND